MTIRKPSLVAITGAAGFLGSRLAAHMAKHYPVRLFDVKQVPGEWDSRIGNVADMDDAMALCEGASDLVISHMAPNRPEVYATPQIPFDVNAKGTANLFHAAVKCGVSRVVLISSIAVVGEQHSKGVFLTHDLPARPMNIYGLTKTIQETTADYYFRTVGLECAMLRPAYICDEDSLSDKYGRHVPTVNWQFIDPRDIAEAARLALVVPRLGCQIFYTLGHPDADSHADVKRTRDILGWRPQYTFEKYPRDAV